MVIYINTHANNGTARKKWASVEQRVLDRLRQGDAEPDVRELPTDLAASVMSDVENGKRVFIAAGGDGTVHMLVNALMAAKKETGHDLVLGAVGLGSSNDYHKPVLPGQMIDGVPVRINAEKTSSHNLGQADCLLTDEKPEKRYFIVNSSLGILAEGNHLFNKGDAVINRLKKRWVNGTINYSAIKTMMVYKNFGVTFSMNNDSFQTQVSNMSIIINPNFTGSYCYDTPITPQSDYLCVNLCENMSRPEQLYTFYQFGKGRFLGLRKTRAWNTPEVKIVPEKQVPFEMDGEVTMVKQVDITLVKGGLTVCH